MTSAPSAPKKKERQEESRNQEEELNWNFKVGDNKKLKITFIHKKQMSFLSTKDTCVLTFVPLESDSQRETGYNLQRDMFQKSRMASSLQVLITKVFNLNYNLPHLLLGETCS